jgi:hypothetical protein
VPANATPEIAASAEAKLTAQVHGTQLKTPDRGWQTRRELGPERWAAVEALKVGQLSPLVRTAFGVHRLQLIERRAERAQSWAEAKDRLSTEFKRGRTFEAGHALLLKLRGESKIQRMVPFDRPPGGIPLAGPLTSTGFEEDDD